MIEKACRKCGETDPIEKFRVNATMADGHSNHCRPCEAETARKRYYQNSEHVKARVKARYATLTREQRQALGKRRLIRNAHKRKAHGQVNRALRRGDIQRKDTCEHCADPAEHAHHEDYARPLDVIWLCRKCHGLVHRKQSA